MVRDCLLELFSHEPHLIKVGLFEQGDDFAVLLLGYVTQFAHHTQNSHLGRHFHQAEIVNGIPATGKTLWLSLNEWEVFQTGNSEALKALSKAITAVSEVLIGNPQRLSYWVSTVIYLMKKAILLI